MAILNDKKKEYISRILMSRMRILMNNGFYGLLLMHMKYSLNDEIETAATDGVRIYFNPDFFDDISDAELDFVMMHEILHVVLQHCFRNEKKDNERFNIACDIVVNSNILFSEKMNKKAITLKNYGECMHIAPDGKEGYEYTAEQVYEMLPPKKQGNVLKENFKRKSNSKLSSKEPMPYGEQNLIGEFDALSWDNHCGWGKENDDSSVSDAWVKRLNDTYEAIAIRESTEHRGTIPICAERLLEKLRKPQTDWRTILNGIIQAEIVDYSFTPPDKRFWESPFFLPDFNEREYVAKNILFMIDTSGSMSDEMVTAAYSEVKGAIDQYDGKLVGWLGFFDTEIVEPKLFENEEEFRVIKPSGGGGTDFYIIFEYVKKYMCDELPLCIIILTDGYAPYPEEDIAMGIPVLWLLNNEKVNPEWGMIARIKI